MLKPYISRNADIQNDSSATVLHIIAQIKKNPSPETMSENIPDKFTQYKLNNSDILKHLDS
jgi:hypothetical protein